MPQRSNTCISSVTAPYSEANTVKKSLRPSPLGLNALGAKRNEAGDQVRRYDWLGMWHYLFEFSTDGTLTIDRSTSIDFEALGQLILALDDVAKPNGLRIKMVILKIELKDDFFKTKAGRKVKNRGIYFAQSLPDWTNRMHDDHIHVDFQVK